MILRLNVRTSLKVEHDQSVCNIVGARKLSVQGGPKRAYSRGRSGVDAECQIEDP